MTHTFSKTLYHLVWSTKNREPYIDYNIKDPLYAYMKGIMENKKSKLYIINGMPDHVHLLISLPLNQTVSNIVQQVKVSSTRWLRSQYPQLKQFSWQEGLGAFTISYSQLNNVKKYIAMQEEHHQTKTFNEEYLEFLNLLDISYDPRFVFG